MQSSQQFATHYLTLFDGMCAESAVFGGWVVEGLLDIGKLEHALCRLVAKWPLLAGRLQQVEKMRYTVKVPHGPFVDGYAPFVITSSTSERPISDFMKHPVPVVSDVLPLSFFVHSSTPCTTSTWVTQQLPLMFWHLTYFKHRGNEVTCIGMTVSHALVDGPGMGLIFKALEAETLGKPWVAPPMPHVGDNENPLQVFLDRAEKDAASNKEKLPNPVDYPTLGLGGLWFLLSYILFNLWQQIWHKASMRLVLLPPEAIDHLVNDCRRAKERDGLKGLDLSSGDILTAWLYKAIYSEEPLGRRINLCNMVSFRMFPTAGLDNYMHNCFIPNQYQIFTVAELQVLPLHVLAAKIAASKSVTSLSHGLLTYKYLHISAQPSRSLIRVVPYDISPNVDENLTISNMTTANVVQFDWSGVGGGRTLCRYKKVMSPAPVLATNVVTISGQLEDGRMVIDVAVSRRKMKSLEVAISRLIDEHTAEI
ncbi:hypothetical protein CPB84DRAFT_1680646 [Gymnopilus junonius]|uniref:Uncharacterized protein n=1 Tax=Gymnopilus junonius TaxID=109634 RepID=A0A9P5NPI5_GYMJU|nr:hypothetical protein CPB84DRAFT_1680646 [Gymnopilus junonius]